VSVCVTVAIFTTRTEDIIRPKPLMRSVCGQFTVKRVDCSCWRCGRIKDGFVSGRIVTMSGLFVGFLSLASW